MTDKQKEEDSAIIKMLYDTASPIEQGPFDDLPTTPITDGDIELILSGASHNEIGIKMQENRVSERTKSIGRTFSIGDIWDGGGGVHRLVEITEEGEERWEVVGKDE